MESLQPQLLHETSNLSNFSPNLAAVCLVPDTEEHRASLQILWPHTSHLVVRVECPQSLQHFELLPHSWHSRYLPLLFVTPGHACLKPPVSAGGIWRLKTSAESALVIRSQGPSPLTGIPPPLLDLNFWLPPSDCILSGRHQYICVRSYLLMPRFYFKIHLHASTLLTNVL